MASRLSVAIHLVLMLVIAVLVFIVLDGRRAYGHQAEVQRLRAEKAEQRVRDLLAEVEAARHELRFAREDERQARRELAAMRPGPIDAAQHAANDARLAERGPLPHPDDPIWAHTAVTSEPTSISGESAAPAAGQLASTIDSPGATTTTPEKSAATAAASPDAPPAAPPSPAPPAADLDALLAQAEKELRERYRDHPELLKQMLEVLHRTRQANKPE